MEKSPPNKSWKPSRPLDTPYRRASQEWDRRMGATVVQARNWRLAAFSSFGLTLVSLVGVIYLGAQPKAVPHIVQVDKIGAPTYLGPAGQSARDYHVSDLSIKYHLRRWIEQTRSISFDTQIVQRNWNEAYQLVTQNSANQLSAYAERLNPVQRATEQRVTVDVVATVQISKDTWQVDWAERTYDKRATLLSDLLWRGTFRIVFRTPEGEEAIALNPLGLFIDEFHWSRVQT